jgi:flagellar basal-body rod modification protein FlgD
MDINALTQSTSTTSKSNSSLGKISDDFDMFLTLLTTQLQNQDPLDPMDNTEMTNQLVNFASVEQQISQNTNLEQLIALQQASANSAAVGYIGKDVQIDSDTTQFSGDPVTFGYTPKGGAETLSINVVDLDGNMITTFEGETSAQRHEVTWDGTNADGDTVPEGTYRFLVNAFDAEGEAIQTSQTDVTGHVTGSAGDDSGVYVLLGDMAVNLTKVISVQAPKTT